MNSECETDWRGAVVTKCQNYGLHLDWVHRKFLANLDAHCRKYPRTDWRAVCAEFVKADSEKLLRWYAYRPIKEFTQSIRAREKLRAHAAAMD